MSKGELTRKLPKLRNLLDDDKLIEQMVELRKRKEDIKTFLGSSCYDVMIAIVQKISDKGVDNIDQSELATMFKKVAEVAKTLDDKGGNVNIQINQGMMSDEEAKRFDVEI